MRILVGGLALALLSLTPVARSAQPVLQTLAGTITTGSGGDIQPVRRAKVTLSGAGLQTPRIVDTDAAGAYRFEGVPATPLRIRAQKAGFVTLDAVVEQNAALTMTRAGAVEGSASTPAGDPVWNVLVSAVQPQPAGAPKILAQTRTDDLGRYRLHSLAPGDYLVSASMDRLTLQTVSALPGANDPAVTYHPAAHAIDAARPVRVLAGRDTSAIDIAVSANEPVSESGASAAPRRDATGVGRIFGSVVDAVSGKPIARARILLLPASGQGPRLTNWTRSDDKGRFEYTALSAQRYTLRVTAPRFVSLEYGQKEPGDAGAEILLRDGEPFRVDIKLSPTNAIEGMLLDEFGDPAPNITVAVAQRLYVAGRHRLIPGNRSVAPTDDRDYYRITGLEPGQYYVIAQSGVFTDANEVGGFAPTYYPGTIDAEAATPVSLTTGVDSQSTTFALVPSKTFTVAGTMVDVDGRPVSGRGTLMLSAPDRVQALDASVARTPTAADGTFVLRNVPQGQYTLQGFAPPPPGYRGPANLAAMPFGWLPVAVGDVGIDGLVLRTTPGTTLRGRIVTEEGTAPPLAPDQVEISTLPIELDSAPRSGGPPPSSVHEDLTFEVFRQYGWRRLVISVHDPDWMVKAVTIDDADVTDAPIDLRTKDVDGMKIVVTTRVSGVFGGVWDDRGPANDYTVVVFSSDPTKWTDRSRFVATARPTQSGRFTIPALPPEDYLAVALATTAGSQSTDPEFLQQVRPLATAFTLGQGEKKSLELRLRRRP